jgi:hypothetical protein
MSHVFPQIVQKRVLRSHARQNLLSFTTYTKADYATNWHHAELARKLDDVATGRCRRLMVIRRLFYIINPLVG